MTWGAIGGAAVSVVGGALINKNKGGGGGGGTTTQELDPRVQAILFGDGTDANKGLLSQYQALGNTPQNAGTSAFGNAAAGFLGGQGSTILGQLQSGANNLLGSNVSASAGDPRTYNIQNAQGAQVQAPAQNNLDLTGAYNNFIYGDAAANPYLTNSLKAGIDATNAGFQKNVNSLSNTLQKSILPSIRSESVLSGQYGGSRQGIAEGNALNQFTSQLNDANSVLAAQNSANTTAAQAAAYNAGQDRSLAATQSLGAQQYGVAQQNAANAQQANIANAGAQNAASAQNANAYNNQNQFNAGLQLQAAGLNSQNQLGGLAALSGLLGNVYTYGQNQDNYNINRAQQVNSLLAPYLSANSGQSTTAPAYSNTGANILGGATAGLGLYNGLKNAGVFNGGSTVPNAQNVVPGSM